MQDVHPTIQLDVGIQLKMRNTSPRSLTPAPLSGGTAKYRVNYWEGKCRGLESFIEAALHDYLYIAGTLWHPKEMGKAMDESIPCVPVLLYLVYLVYLAPNFVFWVMRWKAL